MTRLVPITFLSYLLLVYPSQAQVTASELIERFTDDVVVISEEGVFRGSGELDIDGSYTKLFEKKASDKLIYEIGEIDGEGGVFSIMYVKQASSGSIELVVLYEAAQTAGQKGIDEAREQWMALCNSHNANELVKRLYTANAYYYNRGRLLEGTKAISAEYQYMNNPSYSLKLTPLHVEQVTPGIAFEIGQCSGSYPLPYMLLWEKQDNGKWQVLMDSNY